MRTIEVGLQNWESDTVRGGLGKTLVAWGSGRLKMGGMKVNYKLVVSKFPVQMQIKLDIFLYYFEPK